MLVDKIRWSDYPSNTQPSGVIPVVAFPPPAWTSTSAWSTTRNNLIRDYNLVIENQISGIQKGPNFFNFFMPSASTNYRSLFADSLHPNALGHQLMAYLWHNALSPSSPVALPFKLDNLTISTGIQPRQNLLEVGNPYYIDANFTLASIPSALNGGRWIMTSNLDRNSTAPTYVSFTVDRPVVVFVAYDAGATQLPAWLSGFSDTGSSVSTTNDSAPSLKLYQKTYPAGSVSLGGNMNVPAAGANANYVAVVVEQSALSSQVAQAFGALAGKLLLQSAEAQADTANISPGVLADNQSTQSPGRPHVAASESTIEEAATILDSYFNALKAGDVNQIGKLIDGKLRSENARLLSNPDYSFQLITTYRDAEFVIVDYEGLNSAGVVATVDIWLNKLEHLRKRFTMARPSDARGLLIVDTEEVP